MRELQLWDTGETGTGAFEDIDTLAEGCRFRDCRHQQEPGCSVRAAIAAGDMPLERLENYHKLKSEQEHQSRQLDQRAQIDEKRRAKAGARALRKRVHDKSGG
jgi:ribosome biogenesis GTPase